MSFKIKIYKKKLILNFNKKEKLNFLLSDKVLLYNLIKDSIFYYLIKNNGIIIHSSSLKINNKGIIFPGDSGSGKTILVNLLDNIYNFKMIHHDLTCVYFAKNTNMPIIQPFPFLTWSKLSPYCNNKFPLNAIFFLNGKTKNFIKEISKIEALKTLLDNTNIYPIFYGESELLLDTCARIVEVVPCYTLSFKKDPSIANLILKTLGEI